MRPRDAAYAYGLNSLNVIMDRRVKPGDDAVLCWRCNSEQLLS